MRMSTYIIVGSLGIVIILLIILLAVVVAVLASQYFIFIPVEPSLPVW